MIEELESRHSISRLPKQASILPHVTERELLSIVRSTEFRSIALPIDQMRFLRTKPHKSKSRINETLLKEFFMTVQSTLKRF
jgi:hypothetical protein